jgi:diguanylate cyclase (GGDEF)-like protein
VRELRGSELRPVATISLPVDERSLAVGYRRLALLLRDVVAEQSVDAVLERVLATLRELVRCEDVVIWEPAGVDELVVALVEGEDENELRSLRIQLGEGLTGKAARECRPVVSNNAHVDPRAKLVPGTEVTPEAIVCMPLLARDALLGVLTLYRQGTDRAFGEEEIELVADFAAVAALALDNARTRSELELLATTDDLTGLSNRRRFHSELEREIAAARRYGSPLSLLLLDLDDFKAINDGYGHKIGDQALREIALAIQQRLRAADLAARIGGDEFGVLLPQTGGEAAKELARDLEHAVRRALTPPLVTSASIGISTLQLGEENDLFAEADRFLYEAKRSHSAAVSIGLSNLGMRPSLQPPARKGEQRSPSGREQTRTLDPSPSGYRASTATGRKAAAEKKHARTTAERPEKLTLRADEFELLGKAEAEAFLAARYCSLTEAGWPSLSALALAKRTEIDLKDAPSYRPESRG